MTPALTILVHALRMLAFEPGTTARVVGPPALLVVVSAAAAAVLTPDALAALVAATDTLEPPPPATVLTLFALGLAGLVGYALMAILWHRHVLLNGRDRDTAARPGTAIVLNYLWRAVVVGIVQFLVAIPIGLATILLGSLGAVAGRAPGTLFLFAIGALAGLVFVWIALRVSVVLPAAAMGQPMRIAESWQITAPIAGTLWAVALMLAALNTLIGFAVGGLYPGDPGVALVLDSVLFIVEGLIFVSVLTTLYGTCVEKRPLA